MTEKTKTLWRICRAIAGAAFLLLAAGLLFPADAQAQELGPISPMQVGNPLWFGLHRENADSPWILNTVCEPASEGHDISLGLVKDNEKPGYYKFETTDEPAKTVLTCGLDYDANHVPTKIRVTMKDLNILHTCTLRTTKTEEGDPEAYRGALSYYFEDQEGLPALVPMEITVSGNCSIINEVGPAIETNVPLTIKKAANCDTADLALYTRYNRGIVWQEGGVFSFLDEIAEPTEEQRNNVSYCGAMEGNDDFALTVDGMNVSCSAAAAPTSGYDARFDIGFKDLVFKNNGSLAGKISLSGALYTTGINANTKRLWARGDGALSIYTEGYTYNGRSYQWGEGPHTLILKYIGNKEGADQKGEWFEETNEETADIIYKETDTSGRRAHLTLKNLNMTVGNKDDGYDSSAEDAGYPAIFFEMRTGQPEPGDVLPLVLELVGDSTITNLHGRAIDVNAEMYVIGDGKLSGAVGCRNFSYEAGVVGYASSELVKQNVRLSEVGGPDKKGKKYIYEGNSYYFRNYDDMEPTHNMPLRSEDNMLEWYVVGLYDTNGTGVPSGRNIQRFFMTPSGSPLTNDYYYPTVFSMYPVKTDDSGNITAIVTDTQKDYAQVDIGGKFVNVAVEPDFKATPDTKWLVPDPETISYSLSAVYTVDELIKRDRAAGMEAIVDIADGGSYKVDGDLYVLAVIDGTIEVNGNVTTGLSLYKQYKIANIDDDGNMYVKLEYDPTTHEPETDANGNYIIAHDNYDTAHSSVTITGDVGYVSNYDSYLGQLFVGGHLFSVDRVKDAAIAKGTPVLKLKDLRKEAYAGEDMEAPAAFFDGPLVWESWDDPNSVYQSPSDWYGPVLSGGSGLQQIIKDGVYTKVAEDARTANMAFEFGDEVGKAVFDGHYFTMTTQTKDEVKRHGTFTPVAGSLIVANVTGSKTYTDKSGNADSADFERVFPCVSETPAAGKSAEAIKKAMPNGGIFAAMDIALTTYKEGDPTDPDDPNNIKIHEVEPASPVTLTIDNLDLSAYTKPALFHLLDDGTIEKAAVIEPGARTFAAEVSSFSTYFVAEEGDVNPKPTAIKVTPAPVSKETTINGKTVKAELSVVYPQAVYWTGKKITEGQLGALSEDGKIARVTITGLEDAIPGMKSGADVSKFVNISYSVNKEKRVGKTSYFKVKLSFNKTKANKANVKGDEQAALKKLIKDLISDTKVTKYEFDIDPIDISDPELVTKVTVKAKLKSGKLQVKTDGTLKSLKSVSLKVKIPGIKNSKTYKFNASKAAKIFTFKVVDPDAKTIDMTAKDNQNYAGTRAGVVVKK